MLMKRTIVTWGVGDGGGLVRTIIATIKGQLAAHWIRMLAGRVLEARVGTVGGSSFVVHN